MKKERFDAITDAVLAIIATLMVLEIRLPELTGANVPALLGQIFVYAISFTLICILWLNHHHIFSGTEKIDNLTLWLNFLLLFIMSLFPMSTRLLSESFFKHQPHVFYGAVLSVATLLYTVLEERAARLSGNRRNNKSHWMNWIATLICFLSIPLSLISIYISGAIFLLIPSIYFIVSAKPVKRK